MVLTVNGVSRDSLRFMYGISMYAFKNMLYQQETREFVTVCPSCCRSKRKVAMSLICSFVNRIYYPLEVRRRKYWGLGVFLLQYFPLVNISQYCIIFA